MSAHIQTHPPTEHSENHVTNHMAIEQTLSPMTPSTLLTLPDPNPVVSSLLTSQP